MMMTPRTGQTRHKHSRIDRENLTTRAGKATHLRSYRGHLNLYRTNVENRVSS